MKSKGAKVGRSFSPNLFGAHRYTTRGGMCALREVLQTVVVCVPQPKGEITFPLRCKERTYPIVYFVARNIPKRRNILGYKVFRYNYDCIGQPTAQEREVLLWQKKN